MHAVRHRTDSVNKNTAYYRTSSINAIFEAQEKSDGYCILERLVFQLGLVLVVLNYIFVCLQHRQLGLYLPSAFEIWSAWTQARPRHSR